MFSIVLLMNISGSFLCGVILIGAVMCIPKHVLFISSIAFLFSTYLQVKLLDSHEFTSNKNGQIVVQMVELIYSITLRMLDFFIFLPKFSIIFFILTILMAI